MTNTIKIVIGSLNPVKIAAAKQAFHQLFPKAEIDAQGCNAPSMVSDQPMDEQETQQGAENRVAYCQQQLQADYYLAMEGGVDKFSHGPATFAYIAIAHKQGLSVGRSALLPLPNQVYQALVAGEELGDVMDRMFKTENIKQKGGAIGLLTNGLATREGIYTQAIILAMARFIHQPLFEVN